LPKKTGGPNFSITVSGGQVDIQAGLGMIDLPFGELDLEGMGNLLEVANITATGLAPTFQGGVASAARSYPGRRVPLFLKKKITLPYTAPNNNALRIGTINPRAAQHLGAIMKVAQPITLAGGIALTAYGIFKDGKLSVGDGFQAANTALQIAFPVYGVLYGLTDIGLSVFTGTSLTERVKKGYIIVWS
tara:strand:- start:948 stop:1514 length:567 start_codon:yes stop_codon:yes gene_type:complete